MLKNISHAKFDKILKPISVKVVDASQLDRVSFDAYFNHTLMHEVSHGLGPGRILHEGKKVPVSLLLKELYSTIEEAKADVLGVYTTLYLVRTGKLPETLGEQCPVTFLAGFFRSVRFGVHEAHGRANLIAFNYLMEKGAYRYDQESQRFSVNRPKVDEAFTQLAKELLLIQAHGDYQAAKDFIDKYSGISGPVQKALDSLSGIPVDIEPIFDVEKER
jgi:hypothetical protein